MLTWAEMTDSAGPVPMPEIRKDINGTISRYAAAWSPARGTLLLVGGWKEGIISPYLFEFDPKTKIWTSTMIAFGGDANLASAGKLGTVYILDVKTMKWTTGATAPIDQARTGMACAAAGDNFVVWGGTDKDGKPSSQPMIIYNMKTNAWTNQFTVPPPPPPPPSPTPSSSQGSSTDGTGSTFPSSSASSLPSKSNHDSSDSSNNVYLIGGFSAAVVVLAIIAIVGYRHYRHKKPKEELTKEEFYADFENKHHAEERGRPMDEDYLRERMAHHPQRSPRISPPILDTYSARSHSPNGYDHDHDDDDDDERRVPSEEYHRRAPSADDYNRRSSSPIYEMSPPPPVIMSRSTPTPPPSRRAAVAAAAAAAAAYSDDGRHGSKASYQGSDSGRRGGRGGGGGAGSGRGSHTGSGSGSAVGSAVGGGGSYVSDSDDPSTPRHDITTRSYSPSRYRQPRYPHPNTPSPRPTHSQSSPSQQQQQQQQQQQHQFEPHSLTTLTPVHQGNRVRPQNHNGRDQQAHPDDFRAMDDATLYSHVKVVMQAVDERNRR
ncbi:hypothetical protein EC968_008098 [Mortierella alpina]|nr:hypothetical protein EC968_008098 [Mortierella alpina]